MEASSLASEKADRDFNFQRHCLQLAIFLASTLGITGSLQLLPIQSAQAQIVTSVGHGDAVLGDRGTNLMVNGSFEDDPISVGGTFWANPFTGNPNRVPTVNGNPAGSVAVNGFLTPTGWFSSGGDKNYSFWGPAPTSLGIPFPNGNNGVYFGTWYVAEISEVPTFNSDGTVTFSSAPTFTPRTGYDPVTLSQTLTGLTPGSTYRLDFWVSSEDAGEAGSPYDTDGLFGLTIDDGSSSETTYLTTPGSQNSLFGSSERYYIEFKPTSTSVTITWTNWGHFAPEAWFDPAKTEETNISTVGWPQSPPLINGLTGNNSSELVLDDAIVNLIAAAVSVDFGDAPDTYATDTTDSSGEGVGPSHTIVSGIHLGTAPDGEINAATPLDGNGDDTDGVDDEDGVTIPSITQGQSVEISADVSGAGGYLQGWIDWNGDGDFDANEQVVTNLQDDSTNPSPIDRNTPDNDQTGGTIAVYVTAPDNAVTGQTYARFRWSTEQNIGPTGAASDGEVEDYAITILARPAQPAPDPLVTAQCSPTGENWHVLQYTNDVNDQGKASVAGLSANVVATGTSTANFGTYSWAPINPPTIFDGPEFLTVNPAASVLGGAIFYNSFTANILNQTMTQTFVGRDVYEIRMHFASLDQVQFVFNAADNPNIGWELLTQSDDTGNLVGGTGFAFADIIEADRDRDNNHERLDGDSGFSADGTVRLYSTDGNPIPQLVWRMLADPVDDIAADGLYFASEVCLPVDRSDADTSYGETTHGVRSGFTLGSQIDLDASPVGNATATGDDDNDVDDEDAISSFPALTLGNTSYTLSNIPLTNPTSSTATLHGWIDFDGSGTFESDEYASASIASGDTSGSLSWSSLPGIATGTTYARFRLTTAPLTDDGATAGDERATDPASDGEVEDYEVFISGDPEVLLIKRITAINGLATNPNDGTDLSQVIDEVGYDDDDAFPTNNWPNNYLLGAIDGGIVKPGDELEYTVYFLSSGDMAAEGLRICDRIQPNQTFQLGSYNSGAADAQIQVGTDSVINLTATSDVGVGGDRTVLIAAGNTPTNCNLPSINDNGTLVVDVTGAAGTGDPALTELPNSTGPGTPNDSYGLVRFVTKVDE